jgi:hypothetical protein
LEDSVDDSVLIHQIRVLRRSQYVAWGLLVFVVLVFAYLRQPVPEEPGDLVVRSLTLVDAHGTIVGRWEADSLSLSGKDSGVRVFSKGRLELYSPTGTVVLDTEERSRLLLRSQVGSEIELSAGDDSTKLSMHHGEQRFHTWLVGKLGMIELLDGEQTVWHAGDELK